MLAKDIRFIKTSHSFRSVSGYDFYRNPFYWILAGFLFLGWAVFGFLAAGSRQDAFAGVKDLQFRRSHAIARQKLKGAKRLLREEKQEEFYAEISRAVYGYFAGKLGVSSQAVSLTAIENRTGEELGG